MNELLQLLKSKRLPLHNEKALQAEIEKVLLESNIDFQREHYLSKGSIIDFMVNGTGIEVKIGGSAKEIFRQCERYAEFEEIKAIILVTGKSIRLPEKINNKPAYVLNLGTAWL